MKSLWHDEALKHVSVLGIGNVLLGDDGFGPLVVEMFHCQYECGSSVEVLDLGTPGLDIAPYLYDRDLVILIDAVHTGTVPGTLCLFPSEELMHHRRQLHMTGHDPGIQESIAHLRLAGHAPSELIVVGAEPQWCEFGEGISPSVLIAASAAIVIIAGLLKERGILCQQRATLIQPRIWWLPEGSPTPALV